MSSPIPRYVAYWQRAHQRNRPPPWPLAQLATLTGVALALHKINVWRTINSWQTTTITPMTSR